MKGAIFYSDCITTVSPTYAQEILSDPGSNGLKKYLLRRKDDLFGILNGVDYDCWNPETDPLIPSNYSVDDLSGKQECKKQLQREFMLENVPDIPVIGIVSRFVEQKGLQLLASVIESIVKNMMVQFVLLGSGQKHIEDYFGGLPASYPGKIGAWVGYDNAKAHLIEAGSDFFLMPSLYEPCGLNQIYSMRYGTLPIVRGTGGLADTVAQYDEDTGTGTGFIFYEGSPHALYYAAGWAVSTYFDRPRHIRNMIIQGMKKIFCWIKTARKYDKVYERAISRREDWQ